MSNLYSDNFWKSATKYSQQLLSYKSTDYINELMNDLGIDNKLSNVIKTRMNSFDFKKSKFYSLKENGFDYERNGSEIKMQSYTILAQELFKYLYMFKHFPEKKNTIMHFIVDIIFLYNELRQYFNQQGKSFTKCTFTKDYKDSH